MNTTQQQVNSVVSSAESAVEWKNKIIAALVVQEGENVARAVDEISGALVAVSGFVTFTNNVIDKLIVVDMGAKLVARICTLAEKAYDIQPEQRRFVIDTAKEIHTKIMQLGDEAAEAASADAANEPAGLDEALAMLARLCQKPH